MPKLIYQALCLVVVVIGFLGLSACSNSEEEAEAPSTDPSKTTIVARDDWEPFFEAEGTSNGTFALHEIGTDRIDVFDEGRAAEPMTPASTFKILNSMIALETDVIADVDTIVPWDGVDREFEAWNQDHSLRSGIEVSAVWMYQELARAVGEEQMQSWVAAAAYGNEDIGGPVDGFWLDGDLRISALGQVDFLTRFVGGDLPFSEETTDSVRQILVRETGPNWSWSHKTGLSLTADQELGWLVGIVDSGASTWVFALNVDLETADGRLDPSIRQTVARNILEAEGALPTP